MTPLRDGFCFERNAVVGPIHHPCSFNSSDGCRRSRGRTIRIRKIEFALAVLMSVLSFPAVPRSAAAQASAVPDYQVKATFLFQFTQFVDWPQEAFTSGQAPLVIGILGQDPFGTFLDQIVRNEKANDRALAVRRYPRLEDVKNCQLLFVSGSEVERMGEIVAALKGQSILIVADADGFADRGGMIQFVTQQNRLRLKINLEAARAAKLTISSKLLRPATVINSGAK
jgi:hypothetical protein